MFTALCRIFVIGRIFGSIFLPNIRFRPKQENPFSVDHYHRVSVMVRLAFSRRGQNARLSRVPLHCWTALRSGLSEANKIKSESF
jgi:hypothetical protein